MITRQQHLVQKKQRRSGAAAVELALLLPLLSFLFVAGIDYARIFYYTMTVANCARSGALYGAQNQTYANQKDNIKTAALKDATNLDSTLINVSSSTDSSTAPTYVKVTVTYSFSTITNYPGITSTTTISRTIQMTVSPWTPG